jgi:hypothetical protein
MTVYWFLSAAYIVAGITPPLVRRTISMPDACRDLCEEFTAPRRGNGHDLCEPVPSACHTTDEDDSSCRFLFWSITDTGEPGLIYSVDGSDLTEEERTSPLLCDEALDIVNPPYIFSTHPLSIEDYLAVAVR